MPWSPGKRGVLAVEDSEIHHVHATALPTQEGCLLVLRSANHEHALPKLHRMGAG